jgi:hypothetical protein
VVPFPAHGAVEAALGLALPFLPRLLGFENDRPARNFLLGLTGLTAAVAALTDWTGDTRRIERGENLREALMPEGRGSRAREPELAEALT